MYAKRISKSQFMMGRQCMKRLWLYNHRKDLIPPLPEEQKHRFEEGHAVNALAREYFKDGTLVDEDFRHIPQAIKRTAGLVRSGTDLIYEGAFVFDGLLVRCDILKKNAGGAWDLIEVKSGTDVKEEHCPDAAVQQYALEGAGLRIENVHLMHINGGFVKTGRIDPKQFFALRDITAETARLKDEIRRDLKKFLEALSHGLPPEIPVGRHCYEPYECEFRAHCWAGVPEFSIYDIPRLSWDKKNSLKAMGILHFKDVPETFDLNAGQRLYLDVEKSGKPAIDGPAIREFLSSLEYPLVHLDFETIMPAIPLYDGSRPYQQIPFQASLHVQEKSGMEPRHLEFLGDAKTDPRPALIKFLLDNTGPKGSLLAYNAAFETARIKEMAENFPTQAARLLELTGRMKDLMKPFRERSYVHPAFRGRHSLKRILPALIPDMTYEGLPIANGAAAQLAYFGMLSGKLSPDGMDKTGKELKEYCGQDTLAMVKILAHLYAVAGN